MHSPEEHAPGGLSTNLPAVAPIQEPLGSQPQDTGTACDERLARPWVAHCSAPAGKTGCAPSLPWDHFSQDTGRPDAVPAHGCRCAVHSLPCCLSRCVIDSRCRSLTASAMEAEAAECSPICRHHWAWASDLKMTACPTFEAQHLWQCVPAGTELHGNCASASRQAVNYIAVAHRSCLHAGETLSVCERLLETHLSSSHAVQPHAGIGCQTRVETVRQGLQR